MKYLQFLKHWHVETQVCTLTITENQSVCVGIGAMATVDSIVRKVDAYLPSVTSLQNVTSD